MTYLLSGLVAALAILFVGLEWATTERRIAQLSSWASEFAEEEEMIATTMQQPTPPPPPPPAPEVFQNIEIVDDNVEIEEVDVQSLEDDNIEIQVIDVSMDLGPQEEEEAEVGTIFEFVEHNPEFPGGEAELMKFLKKTIKYPPFCAENGIQGKVVLSFVVEKDGTIAGIQVMRSPADELSKEAMRVVSCMPKWKAGKQRGKPVRVKFVLPITFRLA